MKTRSLQSIKLDGCGKTVDKGQRFDDSDGDRYFVVDIVELEDTAAGPGDDRLTWIILLRNLLNGKLLPQPGYLFDDRVADGDYLL